jgi:hypothetical protein
MDVFLITLNRLWINLWKTPRGDLVETLSSFKSCLGFLFIVKLIRRLL